MIMLARKCLFGREDEADYGPPFLQTIFGGLLEIILASREYLDMK